MGIVPRPIRYGENDSMAEGNKLFWENLLEECVTWKANY